MSTQYDPQLSVIVPLYNEAETVNDLFQSIQDVMTAIGRPYEILAVDDGSEDGTHDALSKRPLVRTLRHPYNKGNGASVKTGIRHARGQILILMDGDGQHNPADIPRLLDYADTHELVIGSRAGRGYQSRHRSLANRLYNWLATYVSGQQVVDLTSGFRVVQRDRMVRFLPLFPNGFSYPATSTLAFIKSGFSVKFVPVTMRTRTGKSKIAPLQDGWRFFMIIIKITAFFSPLKVFTPVSAVSITLGVLHALYKILFLNTRYTNLSILFITTGLIIFFIGLVSEQLAMLRFERIDEDL